MMTPRWHPVVVSLVRELQEKQRADVEALRFHDDEEYLYRFPGADVAHAWVRDRLVRAIRDRGRFIDSIVAGHMLALALRAPS